ncbi:hypothetical protein W911_02625 [Hyphomicrobium nitrativorans NL23]|uniref:Uncharacterized protein n=1 Tax=Hyphomicrobium nitrativorans NL23 TaxID=1029756 RepID=V5SG72_9HYPH|nr:hypothetical protein [Hyphomicrobium nitrativorans]AHB49861.1 hypothetical protein W911_02625 [Hyphomicrobium nitrativorans NL23]
MTFGFLMIVMTLLESGQMSAAFVNTASLEECERRAAAVRTILSNGPQPLKDIICRRSDATFEPFSHDTQGAHTHRYLVSYDDTDARITQLSGNDAPCAADPAGQDPAKPTQYCAVSAQKLLSEGN